MDTCEVIVMGNHAIGKTSIVLAWLHGTAPRDFCTPTIAVEFAIAPRPVDIGGRSVRFKTWDVGGGMAFAHLADGVLVRHPETIVVMVYDEANEPSVAYLEDAAHRHSNLETGGYIMVNIGGRDNQRRARVERAARRVVARRIDAPRGPDTGALGRALLDVIGPDGRYCD